MLLFDMSSVEENLTNLVLVLRHSIENRSINFDELNSKQLLLTL